MKQRARGRAGAGGPREPSGWRGADVEKSEACGEQTITAGQGDLLRASPVALRSCKPLTADFSMIGPYRMMAATSTTEKSNRPIVHAWCPRANINATRCETLVSKMLRQRAGRVTAARESL